MKKIILLLTLLFVMGAASASANFASTVTYQNGANGYTGAFDNELSSIKSTTVFSSGGSTYPERVGVRFCTVPCNNVLFRFTQLDTSNKDSVTNIKLLIRVSGKQGGADYLYAHKVGKDNWDPQAVTWSAYKSGSLWATVGGEKGTLLAKISAPRNSEWVTFDFGTKISLEELQQNGVIISTDVPGYNYIWFYSNESRNVADRPKLVVSYGGGDATQTAPTSPTPTQPTTPTTTSTAGPTVTISASPTTVTSGGTSKITWSSKNATSCTVSNGSTQTSGSFTTPALTNQTTYIAQCTGPGGTKTSSVTVSVKSVTSSVPVVSNGLKIDLSYVNKTSPEFLRFKAFVDDAVNGKPGYAFSAQHAAYMYKITNEAKYCTLAIEQVESCLNSYSKTGKRCGVKDEEYLISTGIKAKVSFDSYLYVGSTIGPLAMTYDWCGSMLTTSQKERWKKYADQTIFNVWNPKEAMWGDKEFPWSGWSINNPGNNYYYSFVEATMYWALASKNETLLSFVRNEKLQPLINYSANLPGGGSLEGTGYGASHGRLFELYQTWKSSTGEDVANMNSHLDDSIRFWLHATTPNRIHFAPIGDLSRVSLPVIYDYHRGIMLEARHLSKNAALKDTASWWLRNIALKKVSSGFNSHKDLLPQGTNTAAVPVEPLAYRAEGVGRIFARTDWGTNALWMTFVAGKYNESHAHQDQGSFTLANNNFLAVTNNIYSKSGIHQSTDYHNILRFEQNGTLVPQKFKTEAVMTVNALNADGGINVTGNITPAYGGSSAVKNWTRNVAFSGRKLTVTDAFSVAAGVKTTFQLHVPSQPVVAGNLITAGDLRVRVVTPAKPTIVAVPFEGKYRIDISGATDSFVVELSDRDLLAQATAGVLSANSSSEPYVKTYVFNRDLERGMEGDDVRLLQEFLNQNGFPVALQGDGSAGNETIFFGAATQNALIKFQNANGIIPARGYFGPLTRALIDF